MKTSFLLTGLLAAFAIAQPHGHNHRRHAHPQHQHQHANEKRSVKTHWVYETEWVTTTKYIDSTKTVFVDGPEPTEDDMSENNQTEDAQFFEAPTPNPSPAKPKVEQPPPVQQAPPVQQQPEPVPSPAYTPPPQQYSPPVNSPAPAPVPEAPVENSSSGGAATSHGEMTYYAVGLGACGWNDAGKGLSDYIVAMNAPVMGAQSNGNPICGKKVRIEYKGKSIVAEVRDKCPECGPGDLDVSEAAFVALCGGTGAGRVEISWSMLG